MKNIPLFVATSKPEFYAKQIITYFKIDHYFSFIAGSKMNGSRTKKDEVIAYLISKVSPSYPLMIGDRYHDIIGGNGNGLHTAGVLYGYGTKKELVTAGADYICPGIGELEIFLATAGIPNVK